MVARADSRWEIQNRLWAPEGNKDTIYLVGVEVDTNGT